MFCTLFHTVRTTLKPNMKQGHKNMNLNKRKNHSKLKLDTHPEYLLNSQDAFHKDGAQLVSYTRQQKAKERNAKYGIKNAKDFPAFCAWSYVSITC